MWGAIGEVLPQAVGVALSPLPIVAVILMLTSAKARANSLAFAGGWVLGVVLLGALVLLLGQATADEGAGPSTAVAAIQLLLGALFLFLALRAWRDRPRPGMKPELPGWMQTVDRFEPPRALVTAALLAAVNPKNLALTVAAMVTVAQLGLSAGEASVVLIFYSVVALAGVGVPVAVYFLGGDRAAGTLEEWRDWLVRNNATVMLVLFLVLVANMLGKGLGGLAG